VPVNMANAPIVGVVDSGLHAMCRRSTAQLLSISVESADIEQEIEITNEH